MKKLPLILLNYLLLLSMPHLAHATNQGLCAIALSGSPLEFSTTIMPEDGRQRTKADFNIKLALNPRHGQIQVLVPADLYTYISTENERRLSDLFDVAPVDRWLDPAAPGSLRFYKTVHSFLTGNELVLSYDQSAIETLAELVGFFDDNAQKIAKDLGMARADYQGALQTLRQNAQNFLPTLFLEPASEAFKKMTPHLRRLFGKKSTLSLQKTHIEVRFTTQAMNSRDQEFFFQEMHALGVSFTGTHPILTFRGNLLLLRRALLHHNAIGAGL